MSSLAVCYLDGQGVAVNPNEGIRWYRRGLANGDVVCAWDSVGPIMSRIKEEMAGSEVS
jgi:TPR repeat protein